MTVTIKSVTTHGLYAATLGRILRIDSIITEVWSEGNFGSAGAYAIPLTLDTFMQVNHGMSAYCEGFGENPAEDDCLVILASFAPDGSEWGSAPHNLEDVSRFHQAIKEASLLARIEAEQQHEEYEHFAIRSIESSPCNR